MSTRSVDTVAMGTDIAKLAMQLGKLEGEACERGYPELADSRMIDCGELVLSAFKTHQSLIASMRDELSKIYGKLCNVTNDCSSIEIPEVKAVFERQIMALHEKRGVLENSWRKFETLLSSHVLIEEVLYALGGIKERVRLFEVGVVGQEHWDSISESIEDLICRTRIVFPESKRGASDFCELHFEQKMEILGDLNFFRLKLNLKNNDLRLRSYIECRDILEKLIPTLDKIARAPRIAQGSQDFGHIQAMFASLPLDLRIAVCKAREIFPAELVEHEEVLAKATDGAIVRARLGQIMGVAYFDRERAKIEYEESGGKFISKRVLKREDSRRALNEWVGQLPEGELQKPKLLIAALAKALDQLEWYKPKEGDGVIDPRWNVGLSTDVAAILQAAQASSPESEAGAGDVVEELPPNPVIDTQALFESTLKELPACDSLIQLKSRVKAFQEATLWNASQKEQLVAALLDAAEKKGGVRLDAANGVYYWIWFFAHEKDAKAGGDNFGKMNAPKDLERLLMAFERALPALATVKAESPPPQVVVEADPVPVAAKAEAPNPRSLTPAPDKKEVVPVYVATSSDGSFRPRRPSEIAGGSGGVGVRSPSVIRRRQSSAPVVTEIKVKCKVPFGHTLYIRGQGGDLDWSKGKALTMIDDETYVYRMEGVTGKAEYKLVLDDTMFEEGANRSIEAAKSQEVVTTLAMPKIAVIVNFNEAGKKLFMRGTGPGMSWDKSLELKSVGGKFVLESNKDLGNFEFKLLRDNKDWSQGVNFKAQNGQTLEITPKF